MALDAPEEAPYGAQRLVASQQLYGRVGCRCRLGRSEARSGVLHCGETHGSGACVFTTHAVVATGIGIIRTRAAALSTGDTAWGGAPLRCRGGSERDEGYA